MTVIHHRLSATLRTRATPFLNGSLPCWLHLIWREAAPGRVRMEVQSKSEGQGIVAVWETERDIFAGGLTGNLSGEAAGGHGLMFGPVMAAPERRMLIQWQGQQHMVVNFLAAHAIAFLDATYGLDPTDPRRVVHDSESE